MGIFEHTISTKNPIVSCMSSLEEAAKHVSWDVGTFGYSFLGMIALSAVLAAIKK